MKHLSSFIAGLFALFLAGIAYAQPSDLTDAVDQVVAAGNLDTTLVGQDFGSIAVTVAQGFVPLVNALAILVIIVSSVLMILRQDEGEISQLKTVVGAALGAVILVNLAGPIQNIIIGVVDNPVGSEVIVESEVQGLLGFLLMPIGVLTVLMIIVSGIRAVVSYGSEQGVAQLRRTVVSVLAGVIVIYMSGGISTALTLDFGPGAIIVDIMYVVNVIVGFTALIAVAMIIYAGFMMIANTGNDDQYSRAKKLIIRVGIGLVVLMSSAAIINAIVF